MIQRCKTLSLMTFIFAWTASMISFANDHIHPTRPNILFIYTDDHSYRTLSCYPESPKWVSTPNIDRLAKRGVRFAACYNGTWCMPSRATMLTGHLQHAVESMTMSGGYPGSTYDPNKCPFWPKEFRQQGYITAQIGKWHTGEDTGAGRDWDYQVVWNRPRHIDNAGKYYDNQLIEIDGGKAQLVKGYSTDNYTQWADEFIRGAHRDAQKPWYLWLCYGAVHGPFTPAERHLKAHPDAKVAVPADIYPPRPGKPAYVQDIAAFIKGPTGDPILRGGGYATDTVGAKSGLHGNTLDAWVRQYQQGVLAIDEGVGQLMQSLEETGQVKNTLVVFTSDQGFAWGQHGFNIKLAPYDATIRSPLIVSMPGTLPEGAVCNAPVGGQDLPPTFFSCAGLKLPWTMHGHDLMPLLKNPQSQWPHPTLMVFTARKYGSETNRIPRDFQEQALQGVPWWVSLRDGRFKYIRTLVENEIEELYDLNADPEELTNLAMRADSAALVERLRQATLAELRRTNAGFVDDLPQVRDAWRSLGR